MQYLGHSYTTKVFVVHLKINLTGRPLFYQEFLVMESFQLSLVPYAFKSWPQNNFVPARRLSPSHALIKPLFLNNANDLSKSGGWGDPLRMCTRVTREMSGRPFCERASSGGTCSLRMRTCGDDLETAAENPAVLRHNLYSIQFTHFK